MMKKLILPVLMLMSFNIYAQIWKSIKGDGNIKNETRQLSEFASLSARGPIDVEINNGTSNTIKVEADENFLPYIETKVENGKLTIQSKNNINLKSNSKIVVYVSMNKIKALQLSGSGNITGSGNFTNEDETDISVSGSGKIKLNSVSFNELALNVSGSGNIDLKNGTAGNVKVAISGSGNIDCSGVSSENVDVKISGSGNARVNANKSIAANISGSGNIFYIGKATNISTKVVGSGKVIKS